MKKSMRPPEEPGTSTTTLAAQRESSGKQNIEESEEYRLLSQRYDDLQRKNIKLAIRYNWAMQMAVTLANQPRRWWKQWLPLWYWRRFQLRQLKRKTLFDSDEYLSRYPDVAIKNRDPLVHFLKHGLAEGRSDIATSAASPPSSDLVGRIIASGLFDQQWYCAQYGEVHKTAAEAVEDYFFKSHHDPLCDPGPLFAGAYYLLENPDVSGINPLEHYVDYGMKQGRRALSAARADQFMAASSRNKLKSFREFFDKDKINVVLFWSDGNFFFKDIAKYVQECLQNLGFKSELRGEDGSLSSKNHHFIVVAPHEYCVHGPGAKWSEDRRARAVYVNTEQWQTSWFSLALGIMRCSGMALDINPASARGLKSLGMDAGFLPLLPFDGGIFAFSPGKLTETTFRRRIIKPLTYPGTFQERPYDVLFVGALNDRRAKILARLAVHLAQFDCFIHSPLLKGPVNSESPNMLPTADVAQLAKNAKILLNIHQGESKYFEWHRLFISGICEGCVVVTEPCVETGLLVAGKHYLEAAPEAIGALLDWLLQTPEGGQALAEVRRHCRDIVSNLKLGLDFQV